MLPIQWEKIFLNDKGLVSKLCGSTSKNKQPNLKIDRGSEQTVVQSRLPDGQQAPEKLLNIINHGNVNLIIMRYPLTCTRMTIIKKEKNSKCW